MTACAVAAELVAKHDHDIAGAVCDESDALHRSRGFNTCFSCRRASSLPVSASARTTASSVPGLM